MRIFGKTIVASLFSFFLLIFVLLGTLRFEILNKDFLFDSFERNGIYEKLPKALADSLPNDPNIKNDEEREVYSEFAKKISPRFTRRIIETNFAPSLDFINGEIDDLKIIIPAKELGIPGTGDIVWTASENQNPGSVNFLNVIHGLGDKILIAWFTVLSVLVGLFFLYGRLTIPKSLLGGKTLLLFGGITITALGMLGRILSLFLEKTMPEKLEPAQALIKLLASSLFPDITLTWIIFGVILLILFWVCRKLVGLQKFN